jgi:hypothetical protein
MRSEAAGSGVHEANFVPPSRRHIQERKECLIFAALGN